MAAEALGSPQQRVLDVGRAMTAGLALIGLLLVLPWALVTFVGWPLPHQVPSWDELRRALAGSSISDTVLIKALALVCWVAWAQLLACVVSEAMAWSRGRVAGRVPLSGVVQPLARHLVVSATLLIGVLRSQPAVAPLATSLPAVELAVSAEIPVEEDRVEPAPPVSTAMEPELVTCVVRPRDSLWRLAEDHLGDGLRWREIWALNRGVTFPDGTHLHDPDLIRPGWVLFLPADATVLDPSSAPPPEEARTDADPPPNPTSATEPTLPAEGIDLGQPAPPGASGVPAETRPPARSPTPPASVQVDHDGGLSVPDNVGTLVGSVLAVGLVAYLGRLRLAQQRRRTPGRTVRIPPERLMAAESELRLTAAAGLEGASRLDLTLRALAVSLAASRRSPLPSIDAVSVTDEQVEVLFSSPLRAPVGTFDVGAGGRAWTLPASVTDEALASAGAGQSIPVPALAQVGRIDDRQVFIDLEAKPVSSIFGETGPAENLLWALAFDLATSARADDLRLVVVGEPPPGLRALDRVEVVPAIEDVHDSLRNEADASQTALSEVTCDSTLEARVRQPADPWTPTVVFLSNSDLAAADVLAETATSRTGLCVVAVTQEPLEGTSRKLVVGDAEAVVTPPGLSVEAGGLPSELVASVAELLEVAADDGPGEELFEMSAEMEVDAENLTTVVPLPLRLPLAVTGEHLAGDGLMVKVLGSVDFVGSRAPLDRPQSKELVVYLALHPSGVDEGRLKAALWPDTAPRGGTFNEAVSRARRCLGTSEDGTHYLPHVRDGMYRLSESALSDYALLEAAYRRARISDAPDALQTLAEILALVRGLPFEGSRGYEWAHAEGFVSRITALVADAAGLVAECSMERGDHETAIWVTRQGVKAALADERLYQLRMRAQAAVGDLAGVEATVDELCAVLEVADPAAGLLPETMEIYDSLRRLHHSRTARSI